MMLLITAPKKYIRYCQLLGCTSIIDFDSEKEPKQKPPSPPPSLKTNDRSAGYKKCGLTKCSAATNTGTATTTTTERRSAKDGRRKLWQLAHSYRAAFDRVVHHLLHQYTINPREQLGTRHASIRLFERTFEQRRTVANTSFTLC
jgi:hypothetical protein